MQSLPWSTSWCTAQDYSAPSLVSQILSESSLQSCPGNNQDSSHQPAVGRDLLRSVDTDWRKRILTTKHKDPPHLGMKSGKGISVLARQDTDDSSLLHCSVLALLIASWASGLVTWQGGFQYRGSVARNSFDFCPNIRISFTRLSGVELGEGSGVATWLSSSSITSDSLSYLLLLGMSTARRIRKIKLTWNEF